MVPVEFKALALKYFDGLRLDPEYIVERQLRMRSHERQIRTSVAHHKLAILMYLQPSHLLPIIAAANNDTVHYCNTRDYCWGFRTDGIAGNTQLILYDGHLRIARKDTRFTQRPIQTHICSIS